MTPTEEATPLALILKAAWIAEPGIFYCDGAVVAVGKAFEKHSSSRRVPTDPQVNTTDVMPKEVTTALDGDLKLAFTHLIDSRRKRPGTSSESSPKLFRSTPTACSLRRATPASFRSTTKRRWTRSSGSTGRPPRSRSRNLARHGGFAYRAPMVKLLASISIEAPHDAPATDLKLVLDQLRGVVLPEGWRLKIGVVQVPPVRVRVQKKPQ